MELNIDIKEQEMKPKTLLKSGMKIFFLLIFSFYARADICNDWFKNANLKAGDDCLLKCVSIETDKDTFSCLEMCPKFCFSGMRKTLIFHLLAFYPGLTKAERALTAYYPKKMWQAYRLSWRAEKICLSLFKISGSHDVSDACRHFMWSALLYQALGYKFSLKVSYAHESDPKQTKEEKAMDTTNNKRGAIIAKELLQNNRWSKKNLIKAFQKDLKSGNITVMVGKKDI